jgi:hypothetical protein
MRIDTMQDVKLFRHARAQHRPVLRIEALDLGGRRSWKLGGGPGRNAP